MLTETSAASATYRRDLGNGLILRWSTAEDTENIVQLVGMVFRSKVDDPPNEHLTREVRLLMRGDHPLMGPGDFAVVEDTRKEGNPLVACTCLWRQNWQYEGIPFGIGRPEIVASDPNYRHRGLIRALFEIIHARSEAEGHMVQAITGIPYFYRQFGYEYALDLGGSRTTYLSLIPKAKEGVPEPFTLREATVEDIPLIDALYNRRRSSSVVWTSIPEHYWRYHLETWKAHPDTDRLLSIQMIVDVRGAARGFLMMPVTRWGSNLPVWMLEVAEGVNLQAVMPPILRALQAYGAQLPTRRPDTEPMSGINFELWRTHPVYDVLGDALAPRHEPPYAWYVRVRDVPAFIQHIAPALERRLANSEVAGYTGELKLDFYRGGLRMVFENGCLTTAEHWPVPVYDSNAGAGFPALVFLQLLFGHRSIEELRHAFPDIWTEHDTEIVLKALFPSRPSAIMPL
jgi:GNAT superfamily N-acetyltransferase